MRRTVFISDISTNGAKTVQALARRLMIFFIIEPETQTVELWIIYARIVSRLL
jgi:hypothetical protein